jgi:hypothetical protein
MLGFLMDNRTFFEVIFDTGNPAGADVGERLFDLARLAMRIVRENRPPDGPESEK